VINLNQKMLRHLALRLLASWLIGLGCSLFAFTASAQAVFPDKPVRLIVPFPPGQATDIIARLIAEKLTLAWGQQVIVENKNGVPGMVAGATAAPDGYTMIMGTSGVLAVNPAVFDKLAYDAAKDFTYVGGLAIAPMIIVVSATLPYNTIQDLVAAAKKDPGKFHVGYGGVNNTQHLTGELFKYTAAINMVGINYKGSASAVTDLLGGQISILVDSMAATLPHIKSGKLKALAIATLERVPQLPYLPTVAESGYPGFEGAGWTGLIVPKNTPTAVVKKISSDVANVLADPLMQQSIIDKGMVPDPRGAGPWSDFVFAEMKKWKGIAQQANIKASE
jgi:tripartite-type tricarboxylate transporter receptor subunit TctC